MSEHPPSKRESHESNKEGGAAAPSSTEPVLTPPRTAEEQAGIDKARQNLSSNSPATPHNEAAGHHAVHTGAHHHENNYVKWGVKQPVAIFGYFLSLLWQGVKRWGEMAGKGGGGHAKKADDGHGGGGHH